MDCLAQSLDLSYGSNTSAEKGVTWQHRKERESQLMHVSSAGTANISMPHEVLDKLLKWLSTLQVLVKDLCCFCPTDLCCFCPTDHDLSASQHQ